MKVNKTIIYLYNASNYIFEKFSIYKNNVIVNEYEFSFPYHFSLTRCIQCSFYDIIAKIDYDEFCKRMYIRSEKNMKSTFSPLITEEDSLSYSNDDIFNITSWGADLSFRELIMMYDDGDLQKPSLQRNYVWKLDEASRLIDSILLGLPIPSIFLAKKGDIKLIIDGYQRILTVHDYVNGIFSQNGKIFKLSNSTIINERWRGKTFSELSDDEKRRIKNTTIHAIIFEQKKPNNDTGMFQIFERINTSGRTLSSQEIRNCVYHGNFNDLLIKLNKDANWRFLLNCKEDVRMNDIEYILRFFAISDIKNTPSYSKHQINLKKFLNEYMLSKADLIEENIVELGRNFETTMYLIKNKLGVNAFNNLSAKDSTPAKSEYVSKFHPTIFEAVSSSFSFATKFIDINSIDSDILKNNHKKLLNDPAFKEAISNRTTNLSNIKTRISLATQYLFDLEYDWE